jgi:hypothetical protein
MARLYDFSSKEELIMAVLTEVRGRLSAMLADYVPERGVGARIACRSIITAHGCYHC